MVWVKDSKLFMHAYFILETENIVHRENIYETYIHLEHNFKQKNNGGSLR